MSPASWGIEAGIGTIRPTPLRSRTEEGPAWANPTARQTTIVSASSASDSIRARRA